MSLRDQRAHTLGITWSSMGGELFENYRIDCPYAPGDYDKPCRIWASEDDDTGESEPGCWVQQSMDNGVECLGIQIPDNSTPPWSMYVTGSGDDGPRLMHVDLAGDVKP